MTASVVVIGAGLVGLSCAWLLRQRGHDVLLIGDDDPDSRGAPGSEAALGVLMARVFHRSSGRGWRLRQRSLALWQAWRRELAGRGRPIPWRQGLLLLASGPEDLERQRRLLQDPRRPPGLLEPWDRARLEALTPEVPAAALGGLYSAEDGQLDPMAALRALAEDGAAAGVVRRAGRVMALERGGRGWQVWLAGGERLRGDWVVLAAGLGSADLLPEGLGPIPLEPVLGQALELEPDPIEDGRAAVPWPGAVVWKGMNLIHRGGEGPGGRPRLWLGATLEPGERGADEALARLRQLEGDAPAWLVGARQCRRWQGLRARPVGQPAPLLQDLGGGLLLTSGHYRNGVLLAPASAEWVAERIAAGSGAT